MSAAPIRFGPHIVTPHIFLRTKFSYGLVNLKPILPGHVLICPLRCVQRISELSDEESDDLMRTIRRASKLVEMYYKADSLNIAIQDGPLAGQTVPHVHCHIIPRKINDLENSDEIYSLLNGKEGDLDYIFQTLKSHNSFLPVDADEDRKPRSSEVMSKEAKELADYMKQHQL